MSQSVHNAFNERSLISQMKPRLLIEHALLLTLQFLSREKLTTLCAWGSLCAFCSPTIFQVDLSGTHYIQVYALHGWKLIVAATYFQYR